MRGWTGLLMVAAALTVSGCMAGPDYVRPITPEPEQFSRSLEQDADDLAGEAWWSGFEDPTLAAVVNEALADNLDIAQATQR